jgi:uncharacterized membrane protein
METAAHEKTMRPPGIVRLAAQPAAILPIALALLAAIGYAAASIYRHDVFASNAFDLGVQDQTVWGYSRLQMIPNTVEMVRNLLGDHFHPILMTIAPLYWVWDDARVLLIVQAALLGLGGIPIFWWARQQLGLAAAVTFEIAYLLFWGLLSGVIYDFHHIAFAVPAVSFGIYAALTRNNRLLWAMVLVGLLTRENVALTFAALGIYIAITQRRWQLAGAVVGVCLAWFTVIIELVMPAIAGSPYSHWTYTALGNGPGSAVVHLVRHPISSLALLFNNTTKLKLWGGLLGAWLFLPLLSPLFIVAIPELLERLWSSNPALWSASFHYSMIIAPILAFASIDTLARLRRWLGERRARALGAIGSFAVLAAGLIVTFGLVRPLDELGTYAWANQAGDIQACLDVIPATASVSASDGLLPHLSHRYQIYLLTIKTDADYIAIDLASYGGHFFPGEKDQIRNTMTQALANGYGVVCSRNTTAVLERGSGNGTLTPQLQAFEASGTLPPP